MDEKNVDNFVAELFVKGMISWIEECLANVETRGKLINAMAEGMLRKQLDAGEISNAMYEEALNVLKNPKHNE